MFCFQFYCICVSHFLLHSKRNLGRHLGWFHYSAIVNSAIVNMGMQVSPLCADLHFSRYMPRSDIAGAYMVLLSFLRNLHTDFPSAYTNLHSYQQYTRVSFSIFSHLLLLFVFLKIAILTGVWWNLSGHFVVDSLNLLTWVKEIIYHFKNSLLLNKLKRKIKPNLGH
jgi:hypothetical protein